jgi:hypothetical protein
VSGCRQLPVAGVEPGAVLARDVLDVHGGRLLARGARLTPELLGTLRRRGIEQVVVVAEAGLSDAQRDALRARMDRRFRCVQGQPLMDALKAMVLAYRLDQGPAEACHERPPLQSPRRDAAGCAHG